MAQTELDEIKDYWTQKYPTVAITLYPKQDDGKLRGRMMTHNDSFDLQADTIGEFISQGESFLRKVKL